TPPRPRTPNRHSPPGRRQRSPSSRQPPPVPSIGTPSPDGGPRGRRTTLPAATPSLAPRGRTPPPARPRRRPVRGRRRARRRPAAEVEAPGVTTTTARKSEARNQRRTTWPPLVPSPRPRPNPGPAAWSRGLSCVSLDEGEDRQEARPLDGRAQLTLMTRTRPRHPPRKNLALIGDEPRQRLL